MRIRDWRSHRHSAHKNRFRIRIHNGNVTTAKPYVAINPELAISGVALNELSERKSEESSGDRANESDIANLVVAHMKQQRDA